MSMSKYTQWTCEYIKYCHHTSWALLWVEKHDGITTYTKKERRQQGRNAKARHDISTFFLQYWDASSLSFLNCHLLSCLESSLESNDKNSIFLAFWMWAELDFHFAFTSNFYLLWSINASIFYLRSQVCKIQRKVSDTYMLSLEYKRAKINSKHLLAFQKSRFKNFHIFCSANGRRHQARKMQFSSIFFVGYDRVVEGSFKHSGWKSEKKSHFTTLVFQPFPKRNNFSFLSLT